MANVKPSALPTVSSLSSSDPIVVNATGVTSTITYALLKTQLAYQPLDTTLTDLAATSPSALGYNLLQLAAPSGSSYLKSSSLGVPSFATAAALLTDIAAQPLASTLTLLAGTVPTTAGLNLLRLTLPSQTGFLKIGNDIDYTVSVRTPTQVRSDIGAFATASLDTNTTLGGSLASDAKAASQLAIRTFVISRGGGGVPTDSDDSVAAAATLDISNATGTQIAVTGAATISAITFSADRGINNERILVFAGVNTLVNSSSFILPGDANITTVAGDYCIVRPIGVGSDTECILYQKTGKGLVKNQGNFAIGGDFKTTGVYSTTLTATADTVATLPGGTGNLARELGNYSVTSQAISATTRTYLTGSAITIPSTKLKIGSKLSWKFNITKTAAGTASSTIDVCLGTAGATADSAVLSFTKPAGTAAADEGYVTIDVIVRGPLSASGILVGEMVVMHNLAATGHMVIPVAVVNTVSSVFDVTTASLIAGVCLTTGSSDAITVQQVTAQAFNL